MCSRRGRSLAISPSFEFPFCFKLHAYACIFLHGYDGIDWKSIPLNRKSSCVLSEKDRQVIKTKPAKVWSRARQRFVETDHILFLPSKQSRLHRKTKRNNINEKTEIGVAAETSHKKTPETKEVII